MLQDAIQLAHQSVVSNEWTNEEAKAYLWVFGLNNEAQTQCLENATNRKICNYTELYRESMHQEYNVLLRHKEKYPAKYEQWEYPAC